MPGWDRAYEWTGYIPFEALPTVYNPEEGYIVSANQAVGGPEYPHHLTDSWSYGYRADRIIERLEAAGTLDVATMLEIQLDDTNLFAGVFVPALFTIDLEDPFVAEGRELLRGWNGSQGVDSAAAMYFNAVWRHLLRLTFGDELPEAVWPDGDDRWYEVVRGLLDDPGNAWWDNVTTARHEDRDTILRTAMTLARDDLTQEQDKEPDQWRWGDEHRLDLRNAVLGASGFAPLEWLYNRDQIELPGGTDAVLATQWSAAEDGFDITVVPSLRMVVDLADFDWSRWIHVGGQSGHPRHEHYDDQLDAWARGWTLPWRFTPEAVRTTTEHVLTLTPSHTP